MRGCKQKDCPSLKGSYAHLLKSQRQRGKRGKVKKEVIVKNTRRGGDNTGQRREKVKEARVVKS